LDLSFNLFDVSALAALLAGIGQISSLRNLSLRACGIRSQGAAVLAQAMSKDKQVEVLDLAFNNLELMGAEQMATMLRANRTIRELNIRSNSLGVLGAQALASALSVNNTLRVLVLTDNVIGAEMISVISGKLKGNFRDVLTSSRHWEVDMPTRYAEGRYDRKKAPNGLEEEHSDSD
jgi:Ran GTPase-activating protein (RanGAP) involved in mRNA processing and transport